MPSVGSSRLSTERDLVTAVVAMDVGSSTLWVSEMMNADTLSAREPDPPLLRVLTAARQRRTQRRTRFASPGPNPAARRD